MTRDRLILALEALVVLFLAGSGVLQVHTTDVDQWQGGREVHDLLVLAFTLPLLVRRRHPVTVLLVVFGAAWLQLELGGGLQQPFFAWLIALYAVGAHASAPATYAGPSVVAALALGTDLPRLLDGVSWSEVVPGWIMSAAVWGLGRWVRHRRADAEDLRARTAVARRDAERRAQAAVADERARIARELHDLVSHNIGVIVLQAQGAQRALGHDPERAQAALQSIERAGRQGPRRDAPAARGPHRSRPDHPGRAAALAGQHQ